MRIKPGRKGDRLIGFLRDGAVISGFIFRFRIGFESMTAFPLQRDCGGGAARNRDFSRGLPFFCGSDTPLT
jgi:hypothetical protein